MYENVNFSSSETGRDEYVSETGRGVKFVISSINWAMCRPSVDRYDESLRRLMQGMRGKGVCRWCACVGGTYHQSRYFNMMVKMPF